MKGYVLTGKTLNYDPKIDRLIENLLSTSNLTTLKKAISDREAVFGCYYSSNRLNDIEKSTRFIPNPIISPLQNIKIDEKNYNKDSTQEHWLIIYQNELLVKRNSYKAHYKGIETGIEAQILDCNYTYPKHLCLSGNSPVLVAKNKEILKLKDLANNGYLHVSLGNEDDGEELFKYRYTIWPKRYKDGGEWKTFKRDKVKLYDVPIYLDPDIK